MRNVAGIDIGSSVTKAVVVTDNAVVVSRVKPRTVLVMD